MILMASRLAEHAIDPALRKAMRALCQRHEAAPLPASPHTGVPPIEAQQGTPELDEAEAIWRDIEAEQQARQEQAEQARAEHQSRRRQGRSPRATQPAEQAQLTLRGVFRRLASALHPDRETDSVQRARKTALMQRANQAYAAKQLFDLLQLQLEVEQIDPRHLAGLDDNLLKHYNHMLDAQLEDLLRQTAALEQEWWLELGAAPQARLRPSDLATQLKQHARWLQFSTQDLQLERRALQDHSELKHWLKQQRSHLREQQRAQAQELAELKRMARSFRR
jgi:predicted GIY-YIG superfamily endonuclease